jgi:hypothetical protein
LDSFLASLFSWGLTVVKSAAGGLPHQAIVIDEGQTCAKLRPAVEAAQWLRPDVSGMTCVAPKCEANHIDGVDAVQKPARPACDPCEPILAPIILFPNRSCAVAVNRRDKPDAASG